MFALMVTLLVFLAGLFVVVAVYSVVNDLVLRDQSRFSQRIDEEFRKRQRAQAQKSALFKDLGQLTAEAGAPEEEPAGLRPWFEFLVYQSGLNLTPRTLLLIMAGAGLVLAVPGVLLFQSILLTAIGALVGAGVPLLYVHLKRKARLDKLLSQLPDAFDLMARIIRAGQTMSQALQAVSDEFDRPIAAEFAYCYEQQNLGLPPEVAFRDLARRTGLLEVKIFVLGLLVQQQTGGNLSELLEKLATVVRERFRIRGKIRALTAEGRIQAIVLLAIPPFMFGLMLLLNRPYAQVLLESYDLLIAVAVLEALGAFVIRRIVNFDY